MKFMFPSDPMNMRRIDSYFKPQADALVPDNEQGLTPLSRYALYSLENAKVFGDVEDSEVIYRGWMLTPSDYWLMNEAVQSNGGQLLISPAQYESTHHIPNWYPKIAEFTAETIVYPLAEVKKGLDFEIALDKALMARGWKKFFVKDYVKALKAAHGSVVSSVKEMREVIDQMRQFRGEIEGGLCIREYIEGLHDEQRSFVFKGHHLRSLNPEFEKLISEVKKRIDSPFFSIDVAYDGADRARVVELGDGQVSDLVGNWTPDILAQVFGIGTHA